MEKPKDEHILEAMKINAEFARYFEAARWKYITVYLTATGAAFVFLINFITSNVPASNNVPVPKLPWDFNLAGSILAGSMFVFGLSTFFHLLHANLEYGNAIRTMQRASNRLGLSDKIDGNGSADKSGNAYTYVFLPIGVQLRKCAPYMVIVGAVSCFWLSLAIHWLMEFYGVSCGRCFSITIPLILLILSICFWKKSEKIAKDKQKE